MNKSITLKKRKKEMGKGAPILKIDVEKFDKVLEYEFIKDKEYNNCILELKNCNVNNELINALILRVAEIAYSRAFKDGMNFIIKREDINLF